MLVCCVFLPAWILLQQARRVLVAKCTAFCAACALPAPAKRTVSLLLKIFTVAICRVLCFEFIFVCVKSTVLAAGLCAVAVSDCAVELVSFVRLIVCTQTVSVFLASIFFVRLFMPVFWLRSLRRVASIHTCRRLVLVVVLRAFQGWLRRVNEAVKPV